MAKNVNKRANNDKINKLINSINNLVEQIKNEGGSSISASNTSLSNVAAKLNESIKNLNNAVDNMRTKITNTSINIPENIINEGVKDIMDAITEKIKGINVNVNSSGNANQSNNLSNVGGSGGVNGGNQQQQTVTGGDNNNIIAALEPVVEQLEGIANSFADAKINSNGGDSGNVIQQLLDAQRGGSSSVDLSSERYHKQEIAALEYKVKSVEDVLSNGVDLIFQSWLGSYYDMADEIEYRKKMLSIKNDYSNIAKDDVKNVSKQMNLMNQFIEDKKVKLLENGDVKIDDYTTQDQISNAFRAYLTYTRGLDTTDEDTKKNIDKITDEYNKLNDEQREAFEKFFNHGLINKRINDLKKENNRDDITVEDKTKNKNEIEDLEEKLKKIDIKNNENLISGNNQILTNLQETQLQEKLNYFNGVGDSNLTESQKDEREIISKAFKIKENGDDRNLLTIIDELKEIKKIEKEIDARAELEFKRGVNKYANEYSSSFKLNEKLNTTLQKMTGFSKMAKNSGSKGLAKLIGHAEFGEGGKIHGYGLAKTVASAGSKLVGVATKLNPYVAIFDMAFSAAKMALGSYLAWQKTTTENYFRALNAITTKDINMMKVALDAWADSLNGAYSALQTLNETNLTLMKAANENRMALTKMQHGEWLKYFGAVPLLGDALKMGFQYSEQQMELEMKRMEIETENANKRINQASEFAKKSDDYLKKQDQAIHQYQTINGLTKEQTKIFGDRMMEIGPKFAEMFNKTIEDAIKIQNSFTEQSGRAVTYSDKDYERTFGVGRLVGDENVTQFQAMMHIFNSSVSNSADIMYDIYNYANKTGLSQKKLVKEVLGNLKLASKYNFKDGTKGFIELAKWAENARISLSSIGSAIEKIQSGGLEGVIQQAANLQVLGGNIAMYSDPLAMMYESLNDPKMYAQRIQGMLKGFGVFNRDTGETTFNSMELLMMRQLSQQLGISHEELNNMARGARQKQYVMRQMGGTTLSRDEQDAIANKAQFNKETGRWYVNTIGGKSIDVSQVTSADIPKILSDNKEERAEQYAKETLGAVEHIEATTKFIGALLGGKMYDDFITTVSESNDITKNGYKNNIDEITNAIAMTHEKQLDALKQIMGDDNFKDLSKKLEKAYSAIEENQKIIKTMNDELQKQIDHKRQKDYVEDRRDMSKDEHRDFLQKQLRDGTATRYMYRAMQQNPYYRVGLSDEEIKKVKSFDTRVSWFEKNFYGKDHYWNDTTYNPNKNHKVHSSAVGGFVYDMGANVNDGILSSNNQPMLTQASSITPINDGSVKLAKSDPRDTALFAKTGGPFDTLFNGILAKINQVHEFISAKALPYLMPSETSYYRHFSEANRSSRQSGNIKVEPVEIRLNGSLNLVGSGGQTVNIIEELKRSPMLLQQLANMLSVEFGRAISGRSTSSNDVRRMQNTMF